MVGSSDEAASLRLALVQAEEERDAALTAAKAIREEWDEERKAQQHRIRNIFSVIRTIARRSGDDVENVTDHGGLLDGRLHSYMRIQAALMRGGKEGIDLASLLADELLTFDVQEGDGLVLDGPPVRLNDRGAGLLALAFHELASAFVVSGRLEQTGSSVRVKWNHVQTEMAQVFRIEWAEIAPKSRVDRNGLSRWSAWIEQAVAHQLGGTMRLADTATGYIVCFDLPRSILC